MIINVKCEECRHIYEWEAGEIDFNDEGTAIFENITVCPNCGIKDKDLLTESGQSQMTDYWLLVSMD